MSILWLFMVIMSLEKITKNLKTVLYFLENKTKFSKINFSIHLNWKKKFCFYRYLLTTELIFNVEGGFRLTNSPVILPNTKKVTACCFIKHQSTTKSLNRHTYWKIFELNTRIKLGFLEQKKTIDLDIKLRSIRNLTAKVLSVFSSF